MTFVQTDEQFAFVDRALARAGELAKLAGDTAGNESTLLEAAALLLLASSMAKAAGVKGSAFGACAVVLLNLVGEEPPDSVKVATVLLAFREGEGTVLQ